MARNWLNSLFPASYRGVPFEVETDEEEGGRRVVVHEFPLRDDPFLEDLGESARYFSITAWICSDFADTQAAALTAACATRGASTLVLPAHGPLTVRCLEFRRSREKDRAGYIAFDLRFVREGALAALSSVSFLANAVFVAAASFASIAAGSVRDRIALVGQPDHVVLPTIERFQVGVARMDQIRGGADLADDAATTSRKEIATILATMPTLVSPASGLDPDLPDRIFDLASTIGDAMDPTSAERAFGTWVAEPLPEPEQIGYTPSEYTAAENQIQAAILFRLAALRAYAEALTRRTFPSRRDAITARANAVEFFQAEIDRCHGADDAPLVESLETTRGAVISYLTRAEIDLAPIIQIEAPRRMPALWWSWRLYSDPNRADELASRNAAPMATFMPTAFEALAK